MVRHIRDVFNAIIGVPVLFIAGLVIFSLGWQARTELKQQTAATVTAQGTVVDLASRLVNTNSGNKTYYYPVIEFRTVTGELIRFESTIGGNPPAFQIGDRVEVLYDPQTPQSALVNTWELWLPFYVFVGAGGFLVVTSGFILLDILFRLLKLGGLFSAVGAILWRRRT